MAHLRIDTESHRILEREGPHLEFKSCPGNIPGSTWETYSAFANTDGGTIVLGVEDDGSITGVQKPEVRKQDIWNILNNSEVVNHNILRWDDVRIEEVGDLSIIIMEVGRAERALRPVFYRRMDTGTFRRFEGGDYRCDMDEVASIIRDRCANSYDETVIEDMTVDDLDMDSVDAFRHRLKSFSPRHPWLDHSDTDFMSEVGITGHATSNLTLAGLVMFGRESSIYHVLPRFKLDYLEYGENPVWDDRLVTGTGTWNGNVFNFMTRVIPRLSEPISTPYALDDGMVRIDDTLRHKAVRESVLNAVCNADYMRANPITIERSRSFIKVKNAGLFRIPLANAEQGGMSDPRNATIARMLSLIGMVERHGVGVRFIMESWGPPKPVISEDTKWSCATVVLPLGGGDTDETALKILMYVSEKPDSTLEEIAESVGVSRATVSSRMRDLRNQGKVVREGRTKGTRWRVVDTPVLSIKDPRLGKVPGPVAGPGWIRSR